MLPNPLDFLWVFFYPLALLWALAMQLRRYFWAGKGYRPHAKVICIGNIHSGGSSKTPVIREIASRLQKNKPVIISRGFGRTSHERVLRVDPEKTDGASFYGEEPLWLARETHVPVWLGADRGRTAEAVQNHEDVGLFLLDDGFQNFTIKKDISIICISTDKPIMDSFTLPLGELREPLAAIKHASGVLLVRGQDEASHFMWQKYFKEEWPETPLFVAEQRFTCSEKLSEGKWIAFCGIASPVRFRKTLDLLKCNSIFHEFKDHHHYSKVDVRQLIRTGKEKNVAGYVTTEKDAVKVKELFCAEGEKISIVKMRVDIEEKFFTDLIDA